MAWSSSKCESLWDSHTAGATKDAEAEGAHGAECTPGSGGGDDDHEFWDVLGPEAKVEDKERANPFSAFAFGE